MRASACNPGRGNDATTGNGRRICLDGTQAVKLVLQPLESRGVRFLDHAAATGDDLHAGQGRVQSAGSDVHGP
jgi:hypothetical protein